MFNQVQMEKKWINEKWERREAYYECKKLKEATLNDTWFMSSS